MGLSAATLLKNKDAAKPGEVMNPYAGCLVISASDYAKRLNLLMNDGCYNGVRYLSHESVKTMITPQFARNKYNEQAMPAVKSTGLYGGKPLHYHTGSAYGVYALYSFDVTTGFGVVVVSTGSVSARDKYGLYGLPSTISNTFYGKSSMFQ